MEDARARPAPEVIRVPPPAGRIMPTALSVIIGVCTCVFAVAVLGATGGAPGEVLTLTGVVAGMVLTCLGPFLNAHYARVRAEHVASSPERAPDAVAASVARQWERPLTYPGPGDIRAALGEHPPSDPARSRIVCLGRVEVPDIDDEFFEPEIITPTRALGLRLWFVPAAAFILLLWILQFSAVIPSGTIRLGSFAYFLGMGVAVGVTWVWRSAVRPTYIRMAPGVIQIMQYHYRRRKPTIRSYPFDGETLAIVRGPVLRRKPGLLVLTLLREGREDKLEFSGMRARDAAIACAWRAMLSTSRLPPLSDEELTG